MPHAHFKEQLQELLDERLDAATRAEVERHLETCLECRREFEALRWTKQFAAKQFAPIESAPELRENIRRGLFGTKRRDKTKMLPRAKTKMVRNLAWAAVAVAAAILMISYFLTRPNLPEVIASNYRAYEAQRLPLEVKTSDVKRLETFYDDRGVPFRVHVFDLRKMGYRLIGGRVQRRRARASALFVYRGPANQELLCEMYLGTVKEFPSGAVRRENKGIKFYIYKINGVTAVFWAEGSVICVLASDMAEEKVVRLAFAKAKSS